MEKRYVYCPGLLPTGLPCRLPLGEFTEFGQVQSLPGTRVLSLATGGFKLLCSRCGDFYCWEQTMIVPVAKVEYLLGIAKAAGKHDLKFNSDRRYRYERVRQRQVFIAPMHQFSNGPVDPDEPPEADCE